MDGKCNLFQHNRIIILGAGIIGCTTARLLLEKGFKVTLVAKHIPGDEDIWYASNWAGAIWHAGDLKNDKYRYMRAVSFRRFMNDYQFNKECGVCLVNVKEYFEKAPESMADLLGRKINPNFRSMSTDQFKKLGFEYGCQYDTLVIEPPRYLRFMKKKIEELGGIFIKKEILAVEEIYDMFPDSTVFVNASGIGPKYIKGLEDIKCYPNRGQNVLVTTDTSTAFLRSGEEYTYVIPRPLQGVVVCGGINQGDVDTPSIDMSIAEDEIKRAHKLAPEAVSESPDIAGYVVGIRPAREGGFRLEKEASGDGKFILHAYGFNGSGYAFSYGAAHYVSTMVEELEKSICIS